MDGVFSVTVDGFQSWISSHDVGAKLIFNCSDSNDTATCNRIVIKECYTTFKRIRDYVLISSMCVAIFTVMCLIVFVIIREFSQRPEYTATYYVKADVVDDYY